MMADNFNDMYCIAADIIAAGARWEPILETYQFCDGSRGVFTDIRDGAMETQQELAANGELVRVSVLRFVAIHGGDF